MADKNLATITSFMPFTYNLTKFAIVDTNMSHSYKLSF